MRPQRSHILVVDDHQAVRDLLETMLVTEGFAVTSVENGFEALRVIDCQPIDLAIVEVGVSGSIDGLEIVRQARARRPTLRALFMSDARCQPVCDDPRCDDFVAKPFFDREFLGCVFEILYRPPESLRNRRM
jgi:CheY-like chemotaxis protein